MQKCGSPNQPTWGVTEASHAGPAVSKKGRPLSPTTMSAEHTPSDFIFGEFLERAVNQGIVVGPCAQNVLQATDLLRQYLASPHMVNAEDDDLDPSCALMKVEIQILVISLIRVLQRLRSGPIESTHTGLPNEANHEKVLAELEPHLHQIADSFGLRPDEHKSGPRATRQVQADS